MYKLIACDLDETLLDSHGQIPSCNITAIQDARRHGVKFVPATGRGYQFVRSILKTLGLWDVPEEYVISFNGGAITENRGEQLLHFSGISFSQAEALYQRGMAYDVCTHVYTKDAVYAYHLPQHERDYLNGRMELLETFEKDLSFLHGQEIVKMLYMNTDFSYLRHIEQELLDITADMDVSYSANRYLEFNRKGVNKGTGLLKLAELLGIKPEETIAIGDNFNDLSMIQAAGLGVGVQNTIADMKPFCDVITNSSNTEGAVAEVIHRYVLR